MAERTEIERAGFTRNKKSMFLIVPIVLLLGAALALTVYFAVDQGAWERLLGSTQRVGQQQAQAGQTGSSTLGPVIKLDDFVVNVTDGERTRYLKAGLSLEAINSRTKSEIKNRKPQIRDAILFHASNKSFRELRDLQGKKQLQAEIQHKINSILQSGKVRQVFFTEFVIQ